MRAAYAFDSVVKFQMQNVATKYVSKKSMKIMYNSWIKSNHWVAIAKEKGFVWKTHLFFGNKKIFSRTI